MHALKLGHLLLHGKGRQNVFDARCAQNFACQTDFLCVRQALNAGCNVDRLTEVVEALIQRNRDGRPPVNADLENDFPARQAGD